MSVLVGSQSAQIIKGSFGTNILRGASGPSILKGASGPNIFKRFLDFAFSVIFNGSNETAQNTSAAATGPDKLAACTFACWLKTADASGIIWRWHEDARDRFQLLIGAGGEARVFIEQDDIIKVNHTGATVINDGEWHLVVIACEWADEVQLYVDGVPDGAPIAVTNSWDSPTMSNVSFSADDGFAGQTAHAGWFGEKKDAAWAAAAFADRQQDWVDALHDWLFGDTLSDRPGMATISDVRGALDLTTTGIDASNLLRDHP